MTAQLDYTNAYPVRASLATTQEHCAPRGSRLGTGAVVGTTPGYSIVEDEDGPSHPRISAVSPLDVEIVGAYMSQQQSYWLLYVTPLLAAVAEVEFRTDHLRLFSRDEARLWVNLLAHLFVKSSERGTHARTRQRPVPTRGEAA